MKGKDYIMNNKINWVECDGGPHILIEKKFLSVWKGETEEEYQKAEEYYEEAGLIDDYIGLLNIGSGKCIVISDDVTSSTWLSDNNTNGYIVVVNYISDCYIDEEIEFDTLFNEISKIADEQFVDTNLIYHVTDEELYLIAACDFGKEWLYNYCKLNLLAGNYCIKMIEEYIVDESSFRLFKFSRLVK